MKEFKEVKAGDDPVIQEVPFEDDLLTIAYMKGVEDGKDGMKKKVKELERELEIAIAKLKEKK